MSHRRLIAVTALFAALFAVSVASPGTGPPGTAHAFHAEDPPAPAALAGAEASERRALSALLTSATWPRRALAVTRLERYRCDESRALLTDRLTDPAWQVRCFALRALGQRGQPPAAGVIDHEPSPRVIRAGLRHGATMDPARLERGVEMLARSAAVDDQILAAEIGAVSGVESLRTLAAETLRSAVFRMSRVEGGVLSPRLARLTGQPDLRSAYRWRRWIQKAGRPTPLAPAALRPVPPAEEPVLLARLESERFAALLDYMERLSERSVDLVICIDCTASMSGELAAVQGGLDDLMLFVGDVVDTLRVAIVAYRDRRSPGFETHAWPFTSDIEEARQRLWPLSAEGGGDTPEAVYPALRLAYTGLNWNSEHTRVLVLVGDAPPHVGQGTKSAKLAERAHAAGVITHTIEADGKSVDHFAEIAEAGGGRCVTLEYDDRLIPEIAGLTLGSVFDEELREFFAIYMELCR